MNDKPYELTFPQHGDERGYLVAIEGGSDVPFEIKRIFYIYGSDEKVVRGRHANKNSQFVLINVAGSCKVRVCDTSGEERVYVLDHPRMGLYLPAKVWKDMYDFRMTVFCCAYQAKDTIPTSIYETMTLL